MTQLNDIAIAGAGVGGLAAAALLHDLGCRVRVFERFKTPGPVGSGLVIQPVGQDVLERVGVLGAAQGRSQPIYRMAGHEADGGLPVLDVRYDLGHPGRHGLGIHRVALFDVLWDAVSSRGIPIETGQEITGQSDGRLHFAVGPSSDPADLIVDATGAGSPMSPLRGKPLGYGAIWGTVDWPSTGLPPDELSQCYRRADRMMGVLPLGQPTGTGRHRAAIFWSLPAQGHSDWCRQPLETWRDEATRLWPDFAPFAEQVQSHDAMTMARYSHGTLRRPYGPGIAFIGDAAHRASPQLGQGANMALLDALALAMALNHANGQDPLVLYARARRWHVRAYQLFSRVFTPQYQSDSRALPLLRDRILFPLSQIGPLPRILSALVSGTMLPALASLDR